MIHINDMTHIMYQCVMFNSKFQGYELGIFNSAKRYALRDSSIEDETKIIGCKVLINDKLDSAFHEVVFIVPLNENESSMQYIHFKIYAGTSKAIEKTIKIIDMKNSRDLFGSGTLHISDKLAMWLRMSYAIPHGKHQNIELDKPETDESTKLKINNTNILDHTDQLATDHINKLEINHNDKLEIIST